MVKSETYENVWTALAFSASEAALLDIRATLLVQVREIARGWGFSPRRTARHLGVTQRRLSSLMRGEVDKFTIDDIVKMGFKAGYEVHVTLKYIAAPSPTDGNG